MRVFQRLRESGRIRASATASLGAMLVFVWWQFVRFTDPVEMVACTTGTCPVLRPNWIVLGMAGAATFVGLDWLRRSTPTAQPTVGGVAALVVLIVGLDIARSFAVHYLSAGFASVEFLVFVVAGLLVAGVGARECFTAVRRVTDT